MSALPAAGPAALTALPGVFKGRELTRKDRRLKSSLVALDSLLEGGIPRGRVSEVIGRRGCGKTSLAASFISAATRRGEVAAVIEITDAFDPATMAGAGVNLTRVLWVSVACVNADPGALLARDHCAPSPATSWESPISALEQPIPASWESPISASWESPISASWESPISAPWERPISASWERPISAPSPITLWERAGERVPEAPPPSHQSPHRRRTLNHASRKFLRAAEMVLEAGGFGLLLMDFGERAFTLAPSSALRLARMAERSGTAVLILAARPVCGTFAALSLELACTRPLFSRPASRSQQHLNVIRRAPRRMTGESERGPALFEGIAIKAALRRNKLGGCGQTAQWRTLVSPADGVEHKAQALKMITPADGMDADADRLEAGLQP